MRLAYFRSFVAIAWLALAACGGDDPVKHSLVVRVRTDLAPGVEFQRVRVELWPFAPPVSGDPARTNDVPVTRADDFSGGVEGASFVDLTVTDVTVRVQLLEGSNAVAQRVMQVRLNGETEVVAVVTRACVAKSCPTGTDHESAVDCVAGTCAPAECAVDPMMAPATCPAPQCTTAADCAATAACATTECVSGLCVASPSVTMCGDTRWCHPEAGCLPVDNPPCEPMHGVVAIAAGDRHSCAIDETGALFCWGSNDRGQLGTGDVVNRYFPAPVAPGTRFAAVSAGALFTCAIDDAGGLWCWGASGRGQLGLPGLLMDQNVTVPTRVEVPATTWATVSTGADHTCGIDTTGALYCWGNGDQGRLGRGDELSQMIPQRVGDQLWTHVSAANAHTCGIRASDTSLWCWGSNNAGRLGVPIADGNMQVAPVEVTGGPMMARWSSVSAGFDHTCALADDGALWCWGSHEVGQLGIGGALEDRTVYDAPRQVGTATTWTQVSAGYRFTCAIDAAVAKCWGSGTWGRTGQNSEDDRTDPSMLAGEVTMWTHVVAARDHACAIAGSHPHCWGLGADGAVGAYLMERTATWTATKVCFAL